MGAEHEEQTGDRSRGAAWSWVFWFATGVAVYLLSVGPVVMVGEKMGWLKTSGGERVISVLYAPLVWAHDHTPLHDALEWYVHSWAPDI